MTEKTLYTIQMEKTERDKLSAITKSLGFRNSSECLRHLINTAWGQNNEFS